MGIKTKQLESQIHINLSKIISSLDNERAAQATIIDVILNRDNSIAKIYVSFLKENDKLSFFELKKATPFIRKQLSYFLSIKKLPLIEFILDDKLEKINKMEKMIKNSN